MNLYIKPGVLNGCVKIPSSKSFAHRSIMCAAFSENECIIDNVSISDDIKATIEAVKSLGAEVDIFDHYIKIKGLFLNKTKDNLSKDKLNIIDCNESGSTLRFMIPAASVVNKRNCFIMRGNLGKRPLDVYFDVFEKSNIKYKYEKNEYGEDTLVTDGFIKPGEYTIPGNISSQFITGLLFTLPLLDGDSILNVTGTIESKSYISITLEVLKDFGIEIENIDFKKFIIKGNQRYSKDRYSVEGDFSQGAFFLCAGAIGNSISVEGLKEESIQGDRIVIDILKNMGASINIDREGINMYTNSGLKSTIIDASDCPDIIPILSVCASVANGKTEIINAGRLRIKECDRLHAVCSELSKLGADIIEKENSIIITGVNSLKGGCEVWSHKDHRICMMLAIAATLCEEKIYIRDVECISKSYPNFFDDFKKLGGIIYE